MTGERHALTVEAGGASRLDRFVSERLDLSRTRVQKLVADGLVTVDGRPARKSESLDAGSCVEVELRQHCVRAATVRAFCADRIPMFVSSWRVEMSTS
jgi:ribosomal 50S subunit-recycling heat shock protein